MRAVDAARELLADESAELVMFRKEGKSSKLVLVLGTNIAVLLDCLKSSRQCSLPSLLTQGKT